MADQHTKAEKQERPNKDEIKGLPAHAQYQFRQGTWYVYFPYCFREDGKRKQKRDYIGTLSPDGKEFLPNLYYVQHEPDFDHRPVERWKSPVMRQRALEKLNPEFPSRFRFYTESEPLPTSLISVSCS